MSIQVGNDTLVAADDTSIYAQRTSGDSHSELWRYPTDGSAPVMVAQNDVKLLAVLGSFVLEYRSGRILTSNGHLVTVWMFTPGVGQPGQLYLQPASVP